LQLDSGVLLFQDGSMSIIPLVVHLDRMDRHPLECSLLDLRERGLSQRTVANVLQVAEGTALGKFMARFRRLVGILGEH
jgi:hypothetical protein